MSFYEFLRSAPYIRLLLPFVVGILFGCYLEVPPHLYRIFYYPIPVITIILMVSVWKRYRLRWIWGILMHLAFFEAGISIFYLSSKKAVLPEDEVIASGIVIENPIEKPRVCHALVKINAINRNGRWLKVNNKVLLTIAKKSFTPSPELNHKLLFKGRFEEIRNFGNPFEFDYKAYMNRAGICYEAFADSASWYVVGYNTTFNLAIYAVKVRNKILDYFRKLHLGQSSFAVVSALTVGDKSYLNHELKSAYVNSGTMHILAVSGMHVALLFWLLQQITRPLMFWKRGKIIQAVIVIIVIWIYALITGFTPSVVRASVMFSFWMLGQTGNRNVNIYNTLAASALLLLVINPQTLFDVGFQLSYMAVLSIVVFYKDIYHWFYFKNWFLKQVWNIVAVSLAAQLLTLPLTLYYFHQFPNYFLLSNIIALPLSTFILYGSFAALLVVPFKFLWIPVGWMLKWVVWLLNSALMWVESLPGSLTDGLSVSALLAISIFLLIISVRIFLYNKKAVLILLALGCSIVSSVDLLINTYRVSHSREMIVYNTPGPFVIQYREGFKSVVLTNDSLYNTDRLVKPYNIAHKIKVHRKVLLRGDKIVDPDFLFYKDFLFLGGKSIYIWERKPGFNKSISVDVLIINKFNMKDTFAIQNLISARQLLITSGVFLPVSIRLKEHFQSKKVPCNLLNTDGYWGLTQSKKIDQ